MDAKQRAEAREQFLRDFTIDMTKFLVDRQEELIKQGLLSDCPPGDFVILLTSKYVLTAVMQAYGVDDDYIERCYDEHIRWIDRKVKDYKARN